MFRAQALLQTYRILGTALGHYQEWPGSASAQSRQAGRNESARVRWPDLAETQDECCPKIPAADIAITGLQSCRQNSNSRVRPNHTIRLRLPTLSRQRRHSIAIMPRKWQNVPHWDSSWARTMPIYIYIYIFIYISHVSWNNGIPQYEPKAVEQDVCTKGK